MVEKNPRTPNGMNGENWTRVCPKSRVKISVSPWSMKKPRITSSAVTSHRCSPLVSFAPMMFTTMNTTVSPTASGSIGTSTNSARYAPIPTRANALFRTSASHVPSPPTVPTMGPMLRSRK